MHRLLPVFKTTSPNLVYDKCKRSNVKAISPGGCEIPLLVEGRLGSEEGDLF